jgi:hypothetical protein
MKANTMQWRFFGIVTVCLIMTAGCSGNSTTQASSVIEDDSKVIDVVVGPQLTRPQLEGVFNQFLEILQKLPAGSVSLIDPSVPRRIATCSLASDQADFSWSQRQYEWREQIKAAQEYLMKLADAPDPGGFDVVETLGYIARTSEPAQPHDVVLAGAPRLTMGAAPVGTDGGMLKTHAALITPELKRDATCKTLDGMIHDSRAGMLASCEMDMKDVVANLWKAEAEGQWTEIAEQSETSPSPPLPSFSRTKIVLTWQNPGREQTDLDLVVSDGTEIVDFKHPSGRFGEWSRSTVAALAEPSWEKVYIKEETSSSMKIIVSHTNGQPPREVCLEWFNDVTGERLGGKNLDGSSPAASYGSRPATVRELGIDELIEANQPVAGLGAMAANPL